MNAATLKGVLKQAFKTGDQMLVVGPPGIGKSAIIEDLTREMGVQLAVFHPSVEEPTDVKGFPWCCQVDGKVKAEFVTYGEMARLLNPKGKMVAFIDDLGHAKEDMQAAWMQPLWGRQLNGHPISPNVVFVGATNDTKDKAGVSGIIEPLKSRFASIIKYMPTVEDWIAWAFDHQMPDILIGFNRFRPELMFKFEPTKELRNSPCPRTIAALGRMLLSDYSEDAVMELGEGAVGPGYMAEFMAYRKIYSKMPDPDACLKDPEKAEVPSDVGILYALCSAIARRTTDNKKIPNMIKYADRLEEKGKMEFSFMMVRDVRRMQPKMLSVPEYVDWAANHAETCRPIQ